MDDDFEQYLLQALPEALTERDRQKVELRYGFSGEGPQTLQQVGDAIGVSGERIRHIREACRKRQHARQFRQSVDFGPGRTTNWCQPETKLIWSLKAKEG